MSHGLIVGLFLVVAASIGMLIKWEFKRFRRRLPPESKALSRQMETLRGAEPGRAYTAPPERTKRAFEQDSTRR
jgi:hypothetical protein